VAVVALTVMVCGSVALLAWTLGVSSSLAVRRRRADLLVARLHLARAERRLRGTMAAVRQRAGTEGDR
jgi:hypothetical protein